MRTLTLLLLLTVAGPALAQNDGRWTPAPTPSVGAGDTVLPAARAGSPIEADGSTPFSGIPSGSVAANGATSANQTNGVATPNLSK